MPLIKVYAPEHLAFTKVKALADAVQESLVETCHVPPNDLFQLITRLGPEAMVLDRNFGNVDRSADACIAEITFLTGRTDEQKRRLFRHVATLAIKAGFRGDDVMITLAENAKMDWSLGLGLAYADNPNKPNSMRRASWWDIRR